MGRKNHGLIGKFQQLVEQTVILRARVAILEIGPAGTADQQRVAGEHPIRHAETIGVVSVAGRVQHVQTDALYRQPVALGDAHRDDVHLALLAHHGDAMGAIA